jgi:hypothetical protein
VIDLKTFDELDPHYQFSSARVFFHRHYDAMATIREFLELSPDSPVPKLRGRLANRQRVVGIGLEVWEPPPGRSH